MRQRHRQGHASPVQTVLIDGTNSGIFTDTAGQARADHFVQRQRSSLQNSGTLSAEDFGQRHLTQLEALLRWGRAKSNSTTVGSSQPQRREPELGGSIIIAVGSTFASNASTVSSTATQAQEATSDHSRQSVR